ncbi:MAG: type II secretion system protein [Planctomycetes bacterium]|nr:type II secretion system protein [Planctomycetota bacterium]
MNRRFRKFEGCIRKHTHAFTLVEILIVVVILGIIAAIVIPKFSNASAMAKASMLADDLRVIRTQIQIFKSQHLGVAPGYPNCDPSAQPTEQAFIDQMTKASTATGEIAEPGTPGYKFGPYLREIPENPINGKSSVLIIANGQPFPASPDDTHGWIYQPSTLIFKAGCSGKDENGKAYFDY